MHNRNPVQIEENVCSNQDAGKQTSYTYISDQANVELKEREPTPAELAEQIDPMPQNPQQWNTSLNAIFGLEAAHGDSSIQDDDIVNLPELQASPTSDNTYLYLKEYMSVPHIYCTRSCSSNSGENIYIVSQTSAYS